MPKAYVILHDGKSLLVGTGGYRDGKKRKGIHLPGGTSKDDETPEQAAIREFGEETGLQAPTGGDQHTEDVNVGASTITFVVIKVDAKTLDNMVGWETRAKRGKDTEFESIKIVPIKGCSKHFGTENETDWFRAAVLQIFPGVAKVL